jgi:hypothetical protein
MDGFPRRILLAIDGTEDATHAAQAAIDLSEKGGFELHEASQSRRNARTRFDGSRDLAGAYLFSCREAGRVRGAAPKSGELLNLRYLVLPGVFVRVILGPRSQRPAQV